MWKLSLAAAVFAASTAPLAAGPVLDRIMADKQIKLGVRADAPPFIALVDGWPTGFTVDLCSAVAAAISEVSEVEEMEGALFVALHVHLWCVQRCDVRDQKGGVPLSGHGHNNALRPTMRETT